MVLCLYVRLKDLENVENDVELVMPQENRYVFIIHGQFQTFHKCYL